MNLLHAYHFKKLDIRKLQIITHDYFNKFRPQLGKSFHQKIDYFAEVLFKKKDQLRKLMDNM